MKWIAVAILLVIVPYTFIRWHYRKPGHAFEPYHDMKDRANTLRLLSAGFQRVTIEAERPADPISLPSTATVTDAAAGLPPALAASLVDEPLLPGDIVSVSAAATANPLLPYSIGFTCTVPDNKQQINEAHLYIRSSEIYVVVDFEKLNGNLLARSRTSLVRLNVPPGTLKTGRYRVTLVGSHTAKSWSLEVK